MGRLGGPEDDLIELHLEQLVARLVVEVAIVAGLDGLREVDAGPQHGLPGLGQVSLGEAGGRDTLLAEHALRDEGGLLQAIASQRLPVWSGPLGGPPSARLLRDVPAVQAHLVLEVEHVSVEVLDEASELILGEHRVRTQGQEEVF